MAIVRTGTYFRCKFEQVRKDKAQTVQLYGKRCRQGNGANLFLELDQLPIGGKSLGRHGGRLVGNDFPGVLGS